MSFEWVIETHDSVQSTQDIVMGMADMGQPEGYVVQAAVQTEGRGRHGRVWDSLSGNLFLSLLFRPTCQARDIGQLSLLAGLSLAQVVERFILKDAAQIILKWPNDVLLDGKKCAGLLLETDIGQNGAVRAVVLGLGVNVAEAPKGLGAALNDYADAPIDLNAFRNFFLKAMGENYIYWSQYGFKDLRLTWMEKSYPIGTALNVKIGPQLESGLFYDIDAYGNLRLKDAEHRLKTITSGEVYLF